MAIKACCDFCERPLSSGDYNGKEYAYFERAKDPSVRKMFPMLCEKCTKNLDMVITKVRENWVKEIDISSRNSLINSARRAATGSKG